MNSYNINAHTLAIIPVSKNKTKIYEKNNILIINRNAKRIIEESCEYYGSSYEEQKNITANMTGVTYKSPILIEENKNIIFFPTCSPRLTKCGWISLNNIDSYNRFHDESEIYFKNNSSLHLNVSGNIIENQILRASRLNTVVKKNNKK